MLPILQCQVKFELRLLYRIIRFDVSMFVWICSPGRFWAKHFLIFRQIATHWAFIRCFYQRIEVKSVNEFHACWANTTWMNPENKNTIFMESSCLALKYPSGTEFTKRAAFKHQCISIANPKLPDDWCQRKMCYPWHQQTNLQRTILKLDIIHQATKQRDDVHALSYHYAL